MVNENELFDNLFDNYKINLKEEKICRFKVANRNIVVKFNSPKLVYWFTVSLDFLKTEKFNDSDADLIIYVWENEFTDDMPQTFSKYADKMLWRGGFLYFKDNNIKFSYSHKPAYYQYYNKEQKTAFCCVNNEAELPFLHVCHPFRQILHWWAENNKLILTHAAGLGLDSKNGVLLVAVGGSGKSTTSITALLNGMGYVADDYVLLEPEKQIAHFIYSAGYLNPDMLARLPELSKYIIGYDKTRNNKTLINLCNYKNNFIKELKYNKLLFPVLQNGECKVFKSTEKLKALTALAVSTTMQNEGWLNPKYMNKLLNSVKSLPVYQFNIVKDFKSNSCALKNFLLNKEQ